MSRDRPERSQLIEAVAAEGRRMSSRTLLFHSAVTDRLGLNPSDHKCAEFVFNEPAGMTAGRLAELTGLSTGAITGVVDRLERVGFVKRSHDPSDRRRVVIVPTPERAPDLGRYFAPMRGAVADVTSKYSDAELRVIVDFMRTMGNAVDVLSAKLRATPLSEAELAHLHAERPPLERSHPAQPVAQKRAQQSSPVRTRVKARLQETRSKR